MTEALARFEQASGLILPEQWADFKWSDWDPYEVIKQSDALHAYSFVNVHPTGNAFFAAACAEFVVNTRKASSRDQEAVLYLDAFWAALLSKDFNYPYELDFDEWEGNMDGMLSMALSTLLNTAYGADEGNSELFAAYAFQVLQHALGDREEITTWALAVTKNLEKYAPHGDPKVDEFAGFPVSLLIPRISLNTREFSALCAEDLEKLRLTDNPYLNPSRRD